MTSTHTTPIPLVIRSHDDVSRHMAAIDHLGRLSAAVFVDELNNRNDPQQMSRDEVASLVKVILRELLIDEPAIGEAVDIAGTAFDVTFDHYRAKEEACYAEQEVEA